MRLKAAILICLALELTEGYEDPFPRREWEVKQRFVRGDRTFYKKAIFPTIRECVKKEDILLVQLEVSQMNNNPYAGPDMRTWSSFLNSYVFFNEEAMEDDPDYQSVVNEFKNDVHYQAARFGVPILMALMLIFTIGGFIILPVIGLLVFEVFNFIFYLATSRPIRRLGRCIVIRMELTRRRRERFLLPIMVNKTMPRRFYRVPRCFREFTDEDEPEVLKNFQGTIAVQIKESSSEVSLDKLYHEFYHNGVPLVKTDPNTGIPLMGGKSMDTEHHLGQSYHLSESRHGTDAGAPRAGAEAEYARRRREAAYEQEMLDRLRLDGYGTKINDPTPPSKNADLPLNIYDRVDVDDVEDDGFGDDEDQ